MHVTFVSLGQEYLGVEYLSAYLKREGHRTSLAHNPALFDDRFQLQLPTLARFFDQDDRIVARILELQPDLLAMSCLTNTYQWALGIARRVREVMPVPTVFGNIHPSAVPEHVMLRDEVDFVCQGEGEVALLRLVDALESKRPATGIPNIWTKSPDGTVQRPPCNERFIQDLDGMPFPDKELYAETFRTQDIYNAISGRGCPYRCTFCFNNQFATIPTDGKASEYVRRRSVDNVMAELTWAKKEYDFRAVHFHDDIFTMHKPWLKEFLPRFRDEIGVSWTCQTHAKFMDDELAQLMKDAGCSFAQMGVQSLDEYTYKRGILKRNEKDADLIKTFDAFRKAKLQLAVDHIFGLPDESDGAQDHALAFYRDHVPSRVSCYWLTYFPGVEITRYAHEKEYLTDADMDRINDGHLALYHEVHASTPQDQATMRRNVGYMAVFHLMPAVPRALRKILSPKMFEKVPLITPVSKLIVLAKLVVDSWIGGAFVGMNYIKHYGFHIFGKGRHLNAPGRRERGPRRDHPSRVPA